MARILLVEDSPTQALPIRFVLQKAGFEVDVAANGVQALQAIERAVPDAVLTDLQMPEMDGLQLVQSIRRQYPTLPTVLATAGGNGEMFAQALRAGAAHYVSKQGLDFEIVDTMQKVLGAKRTEVAQQVKRLAEYQTQVELQWSLENDPELIPAVVARVAAELAALDLFDPTALFQVQMALTEGLHNAMIHGNLAVTAHPQENPAAHQQSVAERRQQSPFRERRVRVSVQANRLQAKFVIRDEGSGFTSPASAELLEAELDAPAKGRGLYLMRAIMDEFAHNDSGTEITLLKRRVAR